MAKITEIVKLKANIVYVDGLNSALVDADATLQSNIDVVATAVTTETSTRTSAVTAEETARTTADATLQSNIDVVATAVTTETSTRTSAVTAEETARTTADATLQSNIDAESARITDHIDVNNTQFSSIETNIGDLTTLTTTDKSSIVASQNELASTIITKDMIKIGRYDIIQADDQSTYNITVGLASISDKSSELTSTASVYVGGLKQPHATYSFNHNGTDQQIIFDNQPNVGDTIEIENISL